MEKICTACKKQFSTTNPENRLCGICEGLVPAPLNLDRMRARKTKTDALMAFAAHVRDRMTEIIANPGNAEYVNMRAAIVRQDAEDLLDDGA